MAKNPNQLTPEEIARLKKAGYTDRQIQLFKTGGIDQSTRQRMVYTAKNLDQVGRQNGLSSQGGDFTGGVGRSPRELTPRATSLPGPGPSFWDSLTTSQIGGRATIARNPTTTAASGRTRTNGNGTSTVLPRRDPFGGGTGRDPLTRQSPAPNSRLSDLKSNAVTTAVGGIIGKLAGALTKSKVPDALGHIAGQIGRQIQTTAKNSQGRVAATPGAGAGVAATDLGPDPMDYMDGGAYSAPVIERRDFTGQAGELAAQAYGPMYAALEKGKANARGQYNTSDAVVKGLYDKLTAEIQGASAKQAAGYDQAGQQAGQRYQDLQNQIGANYQAAQSQENALLQQNGLQAAAGSVLPDDRAFAQNQAATSGTQQQDYYAKQKVAEQDYMSKLGAAGTSEGNVQRQNLVKDLASVLNQYDQQNLQLQGQQSQTALDIANRLSDQDLQLQQMNADQNYRAFSANSDNAYRQAQMGLQNQQMQYQMGRDRVADSQFNRQQDLRENQYRAELAMGLAQAQGEAGGTAGLKFNELPPQQQVVAQGDQLTGGQGQQYYEFVNQFMAGQNPDMYNLQTFSNAVAQAAASRGLNPSIAMAVAGSYWNRIMNRS